MGALVDAINEAQAQRAAAQVELDGTPAPTTVTDAEVYAMIDSLGDVGAALKDAKPESLERLYRELRLELRYQPHERAVDVQLAPRVVSACVRGGTRTRKMAPPAHCRCPCGACYKTSSRSPRLVRDLEEGSCRPGRRCARRRRAHKAVLHRCVPRRAFRAQRVRIGGRQVFASMELGTGAALCGERGEDRPPRDWPRRDRGRRPADHGWTPACDRVEP